MIVTANLNNTGFSPLSQTQSFGPDQAGAPKVDDTRATAAMTDRPVQSLDDSRSRSGTSTDKQAQQTAAQQSTGSSSAKGAAETSALLAQVNERNAALEDKREEEIEEETRARTREAISKLNKQNIGLSFSVDKDVNRTVVSVTDRNTDEMVRQIPSEEFLKLVKRMEELSAEPKSSASEMVDQGKSQDFNDRLKGLLLDDQA